MIDLQTYRLRIGMFSAGQNSLKMTEVKYQHDSTALGIVLICTLLVIGGVELNPGPSTATDKSNPSGPSFVNTSLMDVMQAVHLTQLQLDQLSTQVQDLTTLVKGLTQTQQTRRSKQQTKQEVYQAEASTNLGSLQECSQHVHGLNSREEPDDCRDNASKTRVKTRESGAVLIGSENVKRIGAAAMEEFVMDSNVSFLASTSESTMQNLSKVMSRSKAQKIDVVFHTGSDQLKESTADFVLESIADQITCAKKKRKTNQVFVCSVEERQDAGLRANETAKTVNQELSSLCLEYGAKFLDLRPRTSECRFSGLNKTGRLYTFEAARNISQEILSEVPGFLD